MLSCGKLSMDITGVDCANPLVQGVRPRAILINREDIDSALTEMTNGIITKIVLKSGAKGYEAETLDGGIDANIALAKGAYYNGWEQNFILRIFDNTPDVKKFIDQLSKSRVVVILENKYMKYNPTAPELKGQTVYEAYGFYLGLELNEATKDTTDADTKGGYVLTCGCDDNAKEPTLPITIFDTDLATTTTMIDALLT